MQAYLYFTDRSRNIFYRVIVQVPFFSPHISQNFYQCKILLGTQLSNQNHGAALAARKMLNVRDIESCGNYFSFVCGLCFKGHWGKTQGNLLVHLQGSRNCRNKCYDLCPVHLSFLMSCNLIVNFKTLLNLFMLCVSS